MKIKHACEDRTVITYTEKALESSSISVRKVEQSKSVSLLTQKASVCRSVLCKLQEMCHKEAAQTTQNKFPWPLSQFLNTPDLFLHSPHPIYAFVSPPRVCFDIISTERRITADKIISINMHSYRFKKKIGDTLIGSTVIDAVVLMQKFSNITDVALCILSFLLQ